MGAQRLGLRVPSRRGRAWPGGRGRAWLRDAARALLRHRHRRGPGVRPVPRRAGHESVIPRVLHQIWLGEEPFPYERERETWRRQHPSWKLELWTEADVPGDLELREVANRLRQPAERADILRLELLHRHGGVYLDADF